MTSGSITSFDTHESSTTSYNRSSGNNTTPNNGSNESSANSNNGSNGSSVTFDRGNKVISYRRINTTSYCGTNETILCIVK
jgi:hypothetical protein